MNFQDKKVIIIHSGSDADIANLDTIQQANEIYGVLKGAKIDTEIVHLETPNLMREIQNYDKEKTIIFNLVESFGGSDSKIYQFTAFLDFLGLKYTGASTDFLFSTHNKVTSKKILKSSGIKTPKWLEEKQVTNKKLPKKYIVKSVLEHCSFAIDSDSVNDCDLAKIIDKKRQNHGGMWFAEEFIAGREFNISVIKINGKLQVLPMPEMVFYDDFPDPYKIMHFQAKWDEKNPIYAKLDRVFETTISPKLAKDLKKACIEICQTFNMNSYCRIDFRVDENEKVWAIDINSNPCISLEAGFMAASEKAGLSPENVIINILKNAYSNS